MLTPFRWRLAGGALASLLLTTLHACAEAPTHAGPRAPTDVGCNAESMPTYALVNGAWRDGNIVQARTRFLARGVLRDHAIADDTLDLRGLILDASDTSSFVGVIDDARDVVALRVRNGCVVW